MIRTQMMIGAALLACFLWLDVGPAQAERITTVGTAGTITLDWQATQDRAGRGLIAGHVISIASWDKCGGGAQQTAASLLLALGTGAGAVPAREPIVVASFTTSF